MPARGARNSEKIAPYRDPVFRVASSESEPAGFLASLRAVDDLAQGS